MAMRESANRVRTSRRTWPLELAFVAFGNCPSSWALQRYLGFQRGCPR
jgi:hypothetical protein